MIDLADPYAEAERHVAAPCGLAEQDEHPPTSLWPLVVGLAMVAGIVVLVALCG